MADNFELFLDDGEEEIETDSAVLKEEALSRMKEFGLKEDIIERFKENGSIALSFAPGMEGIIDPNAEKAIEGAKKIGMPYFVILSSTNFGRMYSVIYVSGYKSDWEMERPANGGAQECVMAYVYNADMECVDVGSIVVENVGGLLSRVF